MLLDDGLLIDDGLEDDVEEPHVVVKTLRSVQYIYSQILVGVEMVQHVISAKNVNILIIAIVFEEVLKQVYYSHVQGLAIGSLDV